MIGSERSNQLPVPRIDQQRPTGTHCWKQRPSQAFSSDAIDRGALR